MENIKRKLRCAVYTRKSTEEGLDQNFNSIDAQREAGHAFIASRRGEGWVSVDDDYDDPGFSGGNTERPALKRLLSDVEDGKIDVIVVYKVDRLSRNISDFFKMIDVLDASKVSFVSVTEQFDTSTSMGRLFLNILLSFAQFQREETAERIRHKVRMSKQKGYWVGGYPPLGYDIVDRELKINQEEAANIQFIFKRFTECCSTKILYNELKEKGIKTKTWTTANGKLRQGTTITTSFLYKLLNNKTYIGYVKHKQTWHKGRHMPIIDEDTWKKVQKIFSVNHRERSDKLRSNDPFLLQGIIFDEEGFALTPWRSARKKSGRRYRYYISSRDNRTGENVSGLPRIPAEAIEDVVVSHLKQILKVPPVIDSVCKKTSELDVELDEAQVTVALNQLEDIWDELFPVEKSRIIRLIAEKVIVYEDRVDIPLRQNGFEHLALEIANTIEKDMAEEIAV